MGRWGIAEDVVMRVVSYENYDCCICKFAYLINYVYICNRNCEYKFTEMNIVTRLKEYINYENLTSAQFADTCGIPRPTLSLLLNGRNKRVSDELINKIHDSYPRLSVLWLMFGEGNMLIDGNFKISGPENGLNETISDGDFVDSKPDTPVLDFVSGYNDFDPEKSKSQALPMNMSNESTREASSRDGNVITFNPGQLKKIVNIIVYYSDNSFESFVPDPNKSKDREHR